MIDLDKLIDLAAKQRRRGCSMEEILASLRSEGATIVDSLKVVRVVEDVSLGRAKEIIDSSDTWADMHESNEGIRSLAIKVLEENEDPD